MARDLSIHITKSALSSFTVSVDENGKPDFNVGLALLTEHGKLVTSVQCSTTAWPESDQMKVSPHAFQLAGELALILHKNAEEHVVAKQKQIAAPTEVKAEDLPF